MWLHFAGKEIHIVQPSHGDIQVSSNPSSNSLISLSRSDNATEGRGFSLQYRELTNGCGGNLQLDPHNNQQVIMSPNYPNSPPQVTVAFLPFEEMSFLSFEEEEFFSRLNLFFFFSTLNASGLSLPRQGRESTWTLTDWMSRVQGGLLHNSHSHPAFLLSSCAFRLFNKNSFARFPYFSQLLKVLSCWP